MENNNTPNPAPTPQPAPKAPAPKPEITIPKHRFDEVSKAYAETQEALKAAQAELEESRKAQERVAELEKALEDLKQQYEQEKQTAQLNRLIDAALEGKVIDIDVVKKLLDFEAITIDEKGNLKGLNEQLETLKKEKAFLWKAQKPVAPKSAKPNAPAGKSFAKKLAESKVKALGVAGKARHYF